MNNVTEEDLIEAKKIFQKAFKYFDEADEMKRKRLRAVEEKKIISYDKKLAVKTCLNWPTIILFISFFLFAEMSVKLDAKNLNIWPTMIMAFVSFGGFIIVPVIKGKRCLETLKEETETEKTIRQKGEKILLDNYSGISFIPEEYWFMDAIDYLISIYKHGRVENWRDALDKLDDQIHKWKMEGAQQACLNEQMRQTQMLDAIHQEQKKQWF